MDRREIAHVIRTMGSLLEIRGEEGFRVRSYQKAADSLLHDDYDLLEMAREGRLLEIPGIGKNLEPKLRELIETGRSTFLERLVEETPEGLLDLLRVPGIGPKSARLLHESLGVSGLGDLREALKAHRVQSLPGFGKKREELIAKGLSEVERYAGRIGIGVARPVLESIVDRLALSDKVAVIVGETGRYEETVASLDVLVREEAGESPAATLVRSGVVSGVDERSLERTWDASTGAFTFSTSFGVPLHVHFAGERRFWARALVLTGPDSFSGPLGFLSSRALEKGYSLGSRGIFRGERPVEAASEEEVFHLLDMCYVPPEVRHRPELVATAVSGGDDGAHLRCCSLRDLVSLGDLRGDLHVHTSWSDGTESIERMVQKARALGYSYIAITDHATDIKLIRGLTAERLEAQRKEIREVSARYPDIRILSGVEVDIQRDGRLYLPNEVLFGLGVVVASVHQDIGDSRGELVARLRKAALNPLVDVIGHPTGRLIGRRPGHWVGLDSVFEAAAGSGCALEINSSPDRLDLPEELAALALSLGCTFAICTDAHSERGMDDMGYGVCASARRAGIPKDRVINVAEHPDRANHK